MNQPVYDSKDLRYKRPYGAVPSGTVVEFALRPDRAEGFSRATLHARFEFQENRTVTADLPWAGTELGRDCFSGSLDTGDYVGLVFTEPLTK